MYSSSIHTFLCLVTFIVCTISTGITGDIQDDFRCRPVDGDTQAYQVCYIERCGRRVKEHIKEEMNAAFAYMYLAARFDQDAVNRPGIAKFFYKSASEERQHAIHMLNYLNMRGIPFDEEYNFELEKIKLLDESIKELKYESALEVALDMEIDVTNKILQIIQSCEDDFHAADEFTGEILKEQHEGIRMLQGAIKTFKDLTQGHKDNSHELNLAEYLFDMRMLKGDF